KALDEALEVRQHHLDPRLLGHHLGYPNSIRLVVCAPRKGALVLPEPALDQQHHMAGHRFACILCPPWKINCRPPRRRTPSRASTSTASSKPIRRAISGRSASAAAETASIPFTTKSSPPSSRTVR